MIIAFCCSGPASPPFFGQQADTLGLSTRDHREGILITLLLFQAPSPSRHPPSWSRHPSESLLNAHFVYSHRESFLFIAQIAWQFPHRNKLPN